MHCRKFKISVLTPKLGDSISKIKCYFLKGWNAPKGIDSAIVLQSVA